MNALDLALITLILEVLELLLQYSKTLKASVFKMYSYYRLNPFLFFATNISYLWILFLLIATNNFSWALILAITLKTFDILTKIDLINRVCIKKDTVELEKFLDMDIPFWVYLVGPLTYPYLIYIAFS